MTTDTSKFKYSDKQIAEWNKRQLTINFDDYDTPIIRAEYKIMKKLQNNFTTVEQSKRLLELGVPACTSDCFYEYSSDNLSDVWRYKLFVGENVSIKNNLPSFRNGYTIPCWSVGRLIEILGICAGMEHVDFETLAWVQGEWSEKLIILIMDLVRYNIIDFSKLDD